MKKIVFLASIVTLLCYGCQTVADKTKSAINKTGQAVGEGSSEFVKGVSKGVEKTLECEVEIAGSLKQKGVSFGRFSVGKDTASSNNNKLTVYLIFDKDFKGTVAARVLDHGGTEYGRALITVNVKAGEAHYADFVFDKRTDVESKSKFVIE